MEQVLAVIIDAITYSGNVVLSIINWILLLLVLLPFLQKEIKSEVRMWGIVFIIAFGLQATFWFLFNARGISVVWNAMLGFLMVILIKSSKTTSFKSRVWITLPIILSLSADVYFAAVFPAITTLAHFCAILLGMLLYALIRLKIITTKYIT